MEGERSGWCLERTEGSSDILIQCLGTVWRCPAEDQDTGWYCLLQSAQNPRGTGRQGIEKSKVPEVHRNPLRATQASGEGKMGPSEIRANRGPKVPRKSRAAWYYRSLGSRHRDGGYVVSL